MSSAKQFDLVSVDDYLAGELNAELKQEYVAGVVYAMVGATNAHNIIATNLLGILRSQLNDSPCREFNSDTKVRIQMRDGTRFYYPDAQVVCKPNPQSDTFQETPAIVLSNSTRRIDEGEKKESYLSISSVNAYVLIESDFPASVVFRRIETGFERVVYDQAESVIELRNPDVNLSFADIYGDIVFPANP